MDEGKRGVLDSLLCMVSSKLKYLLSPRGKGEAPDSKEAKETDQAWEVHMIYMSHEAHTTHKAQKVHTIYKA